MPSCATPHTTGSTITLVASSRPPRPTSTMQASAVCSAKARKAAVVVTSKKLALTPSAMSSTRARYPASGASSINWPATRMRSLNRTRWGEVKTWTLLPSASMAARRKAQVEPLPLVPATWKTGGSARCGSPSRSSRRVIRSSPNMSAPGESAQSRSSCAWTCGSSETAWSAIARAPGWRGRNQAAARGRR